MLRLKSDSLQQAGRRTSIQTPQIANFGFVRDPSLLEQIYFSRAYDSDFAADRVGVAREQILYRTDGLHMRFSVP